MKAVLAMDGPSVCERKHRLLAEYHEATQEYAAAVFELHQKVHSVSPSEFNRVHASMKAKRKHTAETMLAFEDHIYEHGC